MAGGEVIFRERCGRKIGELWEMSGWFERFYGGEKKKIRRDSAPDGRREHSVTLKNKEFRKKKRRQTFSVEWCCHMTGCIETAGLRKRTSIPREGIEMKNLRSIAGVCWDS